MGAAGASFATLIAEVVVLIVQIFYTKSLLMKIFDKLYGHIYLFIALFASGICSLVKLTKIQSNFIILVISSIIFWVIYCVGLIWKKDELMVNFCKEILSKRRKYKVK